MVKSHSHSFTPEGDVSSSFNGDKQTGWFGYINQVLAMRKRECDGTIFTITDSVTSFSGTESAGTDNACRINFSYTPKGTVSTSFDGTTKDTESVGGNETRPTNYTIRIWKRTA